jgi:tetratricopeptide (TPR) repeat protein
MYHINSPQRFWSDDQTIVTSEIASELLNKGYALQANKQWQRAAAFIFQGVKKEVNLADCYFEMGVCQIAQDKFDVAKQALSEANQYYVTNNKPLETARVLLHLALCHHREGAYQIASGNLDEALAYYQQRNSQGMKDNLLDSLITLGQVACYLLMTPPNLVKIGEMFKMALEKFQQLSGEDQAIVNDAIPNWLNVEKQKLIQESGNQAIIERLNQLLQFSVQFSATTFTL